MTGKCAQPALAVRRAAAPAGNCDDNLILHRATKSEPASTLRACRFLLSEPLALLQVLYKKTVGRLICGS